MATISKAQMVRDYAKDHPDASTKDIAKAVGCSEGYVWIARNNYDTNARKMKKAAKTAPKKTQKKTPKVKPTPGQIVLRKFIKDQDLLEVVRLNAEVDRLKEQANGYRSVISYLEFKLGIENASVV